MKQLFKIILKVFKWLFILIGAIVFSWFLWMGIKAIPEIGKDVSNEDAGFSYQFKREPVENTPNVLIIMTDDLGYGDLGCYGSKSIQTPNIDQLAVDGLLFTDHYASASVCSPSRYGIMTGRYPIRGGFSSLITPTGLPYGKKYMWHVSKLFNKLGTVDMGADSEFNGIRHREITLAEALQQAGYETGMSGKWHLGDLKTHPAFSPLRHGFDDFYGLNAANDEFPAALFDNDSMVIEDIGLKQDFLSKEFTNRAIGFISENKETPFFYFLSYTAPHLPLVPSPDFKGKSQGGIYGDVVEEMDYYVGRLIDTLKSMDLYENTLILFTSDNGPWFKGSPGNHRGRKGQSFEGGFKVPLIATWPQKIKSGSISNVPVMNIDIFPTVLTYAGLELPDDRNIDGRSIAKILQGDSLSLNRSLYFYHFDKLEGVRTGKWKYYNTISHYIWPILLDRKDLITNGMAEPWFGRQYPNLYDLSIDPAENYDLQHHYPELVESFNKEIEDWEKEIEQNRYGWK